MKENDNVEYFVKFTCSCGYVMYEEASRKAKTIKCPKCNGKMNRHICSQIKQNTKNSLYY